MNGLGSGQSSTGETTGSQTDKEVNSQEPAGTLTGHEMLGALASNAGLDPATLVQTAGEGE